MPDEDLMSRLERGDVLILDGGTGSELQRRGADIWRLDAEGRGESAWSATANLDEPELLYEIHRDFLRVGADVILTNNFATLPSSLGSVGENSRWREYAAAAVRQAVRARDAQNPQAYVAGSFTAPMLSSAEAGDPPDGVTPLRGYVNDTTRLGRDAFAAEVRDHASLLVSEGADLLVFEYIIDIEDAAVMAEACRGLGVPQFVALAALLDDGSMLTGEPLTDLVAAVADKVDGILIMCTLPDERIVKALDVLRSCFDGYTGVYAETGGYVKAVPADLPIPSSMPRIFDGGIAPSQYAREAMKWRDHGAQLIGACCGGGPEHISLLPYCVANSAPSQAPR